MSWARVFVRVTAQKICGLRRAPVSDDIVQGFAVRRLLFGITQSIVRRSSRGGVPVFKATLV